MFNADWRAAVDPRLKPGSPARESGVAIPPDWPDPLRAADRAQPDIGAIPVGTEPWRVGVRARLTVFGRLSPAALLLSTTPESAASPTGFLVPSDQVPNQRPPTGKPIMIVQGYPAFDAPLMRYVANRRDIPIENLQRTWLDPADYSKHRAVVIVASSSAKYRASCGCHALLAVRSWSSSSPLPRNCAAFALRRCAHSPTTQCTQ